MSTGDETYPNPPEYCKPTATLTQATIDKLAEPLQQLLAFGAVAYLETNKDTTFSGWINIQLLNAGITNLVAAPVDVDDGKEGEITLTCVFNHHKGARYMGVIVAVTVSTGAPPKKRKTRKKAEAAVRAALNLPE